MGWDWNESILGKYNLFFEHDETPQFINYDVDGTPKGLVFSGRSDRCNKMIHENRECVTIDLYTTSDGEVLMCNVIFALQGITSQMAPSDAVEKIENLLISTIEN